MKYLCPRDFRRGEMEEKMMLKKLSAMMLFSIFLLSGVLLGGCSTNANSLVGTWKEVDRTATMTFYEDKTCLDVPVKNITGADPVSYVIQEDGRLIFTMEWDGNMVFEKSETKEEALDDYDLYYLEGDTLVLGRVEYERQ